MKAPKLIPLEEFHVMGKSKIMSLEHATVFRIAHYDAYYSPGGQYLPPKDVKEILYYLPSVVAWADEQIAKKKPVKEKAKKAKAKKV